METTNTSNSKISSDKISIAIVGLGYWGPNLVRNFDKVKDVEKVYICDLKQERLDSIKAIYPNTIATRDYNEILANKEIKAVVIATQPVSTHYKLAKLALENSKNVFLEKPMTESSQQAVELIELAKKNNLIIHVDHTFEYSAPVKMIKQLIDSGEIGEIYSIEMLRLNLGIFQNDFNVIWDLCPHDFSILNYWLNTDPKDLYASGRCHINPKIEDDAHLIVNYNDKFNVHIHVSWLNPQKVRKTTIVGSKKMIVYDDADPIEKMRIYDKGVTTGNVEGINQEYGTTNPNEYTYNYRHGDILIPKIDFTEPLLDEAIHFVDCIKRGVKTKTPGESGLRVIRMIEHAAKSLKEGSRVNFNAN
ncbi:MAG TPA: Gfo/Idh/MocA family oxidoreductase [Alphaproteobacteria bacterium]|nr:Gfo/Idh/MocA family oxidoreductase [Alphaproteobacteria bacterium]